MKQYRRPRYVACKEHGVKSRAYTARQKWTDCRGVGRIRIVHRCAPCGRLASRLYAKIKGAAKRRVREVAYRAANREKLRAYQREWERTHVEDRRMNWKIWMMTNGDAYRAAQRARYASRKVAA